MAASQNTLTHTKVILVQPQTPGNIGGVARTMMNFGFDELRLVLPQCDPLCKESLDRARLAAPIIKKAKLYMSVAQATSDCQIVWGTSGKLRGASPDELTLEGASQKQKEFSSDTTLGIVFGCEERGLNNDELKPCDAMIVIPTTKEFPSMNLSHAAAVTLYTLARRNHDETAPKNTDTSAAGELKDGMYTHLEETLAEIGFLDPLNPDRIMRDFRNILGRSRLDAREVAIIRGMCRQVLNFKKRQEPSTQN